MQGIGCYALKISMIEKTPTPHHRKNAALPFQDPLEIKQMLTCFEKIGFFYIKQRRAI